MKIQEYTKEVNRKEELNLIVNNPHMENFKKFIDDGIIECIGLVEGIKMKNFMV